MSPAWVPSSGPRGSFDREVSVLNGAWAWETVVLGFLIPGLKEILLVTAVALALYGRSGSRLLMTTKYGKTLGPWLNLVRIPEGTRPQQRAASRGQVQGTAPVLPPKRPGQGRWFWAMVITIAAGVAAWVATRVVMHSATQGF